MTGVVEVAGPAAWRGADMASSTDWHYELSNAEVDAALAGLDKLRSRDPAPSLGEFTADDFPVPALEPLFTRILDDLIDGCGFILVRGIPVDDLSVEEAELLFWGFGLHLGIPIPQNAAGDLIVHVRDYGKKFGDPNMRAYETLERLPYHTDSADLVGLLCRKPAKSGGLSTIVSVVAIHDEIVSRQPELAQALHDPWWRVGLIDGKVTQRPICATHQGRLFAGYGRMYLEDASERSPDVPPLTDLQIQALDMVDELAHSDEFRLEMDFRPGDIQLLNNYEIMHSRTAYEDWPEPERKRDLCRLWLVRKDLDLPPVFRDSGIVSRTVAFQGATSGNPTTE